MLPLSRYRALCVQLQRNRLARCPQRKLLIQACDHGIATLDGVDRCSGRTSRLLVAKLEGGRGLYGRGDVCDVFDRQPWYGIRLSRRFLLFIAALCGLFMFS